MSRKRFWCYIPLLSYDSHCNVLGKAREEPFKIPLKQFQRIIRCARSRNAKGGRYLPRGVFDPLIVCRAKFSIRLLPHVYVLILDQHRAFPAPETYHEVIQMRRADGLK